MSLKKVTLKSSDGEEFEVELAVAEEFQTIKHMIEDDCADGVIPLPNVTGSIMAKVVEYSRKHVEARNEEMSSPHDNEAKATLKKWDADFVKVDRSTLVHLILAANYLSIKDLLDLTCQTAADMIEGLSVEEISKMFNVENDFTPEEEAEIRRENQWAFE